MVSETLIKVSPPIARTCLAAISLGLVIDAALLIYTSIQYPYLLDQYHDYLYIKTSQSLPVIYSTLSIFGLLISASTAAVSYYKSNSNYVLVHAGINGIFLPVIILISFSTNSLRYKASDYVKDYHQMIHDYRISSGKSNYHLSHDEHHINIKQIDQDDQGSPTIKQLQLNNLTEFSRQTLTSFINHIDSIQNKFYCCGVDSAQDWISTWAGYISPSCCKERSKQTNTEWANRFNLKESHEFEYCSESNAFHLGCLISLKEDEHSKYAWLSDLIIFMIVMTIANTFFSMILFGLSNSEESPHKTNEHELSIVGVSDKPRPSQPTITGIKHRPSIVSTIGLSQEAIAHRAQAVRFNLSQSPRTSISGKGQSKFSAAARRDSSFI